MLNISYFQLLWVVQVMLSVYCTLLSYSVGAGNVSVGKFVGAICKLLGDANSQVSSAVTMTTEP